jgi:hypothetical protein
MERNNNNNNQQTTEDDDDFQQEDQDSIMKELANIEQQKKRLKTADSSAATAASSSDIKNGEKVSDGIRFPLSNKRFVTAKTWKGKTYVDVREFYEKDGELLPGKSGLSLTPEQWETLKFLIPAVDAALKKI